MIDDRPFTPTEAKGALRAAYASGWRWTYPDSEPSWHVARKLPPLPLRPPNAPINPLETVIARITLTRVFGYDLQRGCSMYRVDAQCGDVKFVGIDEGDLPW